VFDAYAIFPRINHFGDRERGRDDPGRSRPQRVLLTQVSTIPT